MNFKAAIFSDGVDYHSEERGCWLSLHTEVAMNDDARLLRENGRCHVKVGKEHETEADTRWLSLFRTCNLKTALRLRLALLSGDTRK